MRIDLSTQEGYDIATALRGPDLNYPTLKHIITGWIRKQVGLGARGCPVMIFELTDFNIVHAEREVNCLYLRKDHHCPMRHWVTHAGRAIRWLRKNPTNPVGRRERELTHALDVMLVYPTNRNRDYVLGLLVDNWPTEKVENEIRGERGGDRK